jgi:beta-lactamase class A
MQSLQTQIESLLATYPEATIGISVYDLASGQHFSINGDVAMHAASTMKLPVMIEVFKQVKLGNVKLSDSLLVKNEFRSIVDGSLFSIGEDSDDQIYMTLGKKMSIQDLVYNAIIVSSNLATNLLIDHFGASKVQATMEALGTTHMKVRRGVEDIKAFDKGLNNEATANDLALQLKALAEGKVVSPELDTKMIAILKDQRFNDMIPAKLPQGTIVAHKTGDITAHHHDAAIVYPVNGKPYILVILTKGIPDQKASGALGAQISQMIYEKMRGMARM